MDTSTAKGAGQKPTLAGIVILTFWSLILIAIIVELVLWAGSFIEISTLRVIMAATLLLFLGSIVAARLLLAKKIRSADDERVRKLDAFARGNAWSVSMALITALFILLAFNVISLDGFVVVFLVFLVMGWSWILFRAYYYFKGDVE